MRLAFAITGLLILGSFGCNSIKTTPLDRQEGGHLCVAHEAPLQGLPVMLRVPTHLDVTIEEVKYWYPNNGVLAEVESDGSASNTGRHVITKVAETEKMFLVDPKRVASGTGIYGFSFAEASPGKGYLSGTSYEAVDTTISESAALVRGLAKAFATSDSNDDTAESGLITTTRTVAFRKFDLNSPTIEDDVRSFCHLYLNGCQGSCNTQPAYPQ